MLKMSGYMLLDLTNALFCVLGSDRVNQNRLFLGLFLPTFQTLSVVRPKSQETYYFRGVPQVRPQIIDPVSRTIPPPIENSE